ncbi:MAG: hypothetical protein JWR33_1153 [Naasia sp.]|jgi:hypothetical protein|uniref:hypothetical protein n=1 Tax=Naasia sp. TaxID=2546198 RepID=UPI0026167061|nr:hypothetical protein [Naasia sp.]MCU1570412.1 hypothetical protein [Naasia sp.]
MAVAGAGRRHRFLDVRFVLGVGLVLASVLGVTAIVSAAERTVQVYAAERPLAVGQRVASTDLVATAVRSVAADRYLAPGQVPEAGLLITRAVAEGELVPASAVGTAASITVSSVVVTTGAELASGVESGALVDIWAATELKAGGYGPPAVLVPDAEVVRVLENDSLLSSPQERAVEVLVPKDRVARVLQALANADAVSLVPVAQPVLPR